MQLLRSVQQTNKQKWHNTVNQMSWLVSPTAFLRLGATTALKLVLIQGWEEEKKAVRISRYHQRHQLIRDDSRTKRKARSMRRRIQRVDFGESCLCPCEFNSWISIFNSIKKRLCFDKPWLDGRQPRSLFFFQYENHSSMLSSHRCQFRKLYQPLFFSNTTKSVLVKKIDVYDAPGRRNWLGQTHFNVDLFLETSFFFLGKKKPNENQAYDNSHVQKAEIAQGLNRSEW